MDDGRVGQAKDTIGMDFSKDSKPLPITKSARSLPGLLPVELREDVYIQERVEQVISERNTQIDIIAHKFGTTA